MFLITSHIQVSRVKYSTKQHIATFTPLMALFILMGSLLLCSPPLHATTLHASEESFLYPESIKSLIEKNPRKTGLYILEKGEKSLLSRAWLANHAIDKIDVQYFIWSSDNIGTLAAETLLRAAKRGAHVRVIVDDFLIKAADETLVALAAHPRVDLRIYNPKHAVGTSTLRRASNVIFNFRDTNQRMHDKTFIVDNNIAITGGRNMAEEYYDYNSHYNFRDRDVLLIGPAVTEMTNNFDNFWESLLTVPVEDLLPTDTKKLSKEDISSIYQDLHDYAIDPNNMPNHIHQTLENLSKEFPSLVNEMVWDDVRFIHDTPGKNDGSDGLKGGGDTTQALINEIKQTKASITIQSPYLVVPDGGIELFSELINRGVDIRINTNSLASTDNILAFSGYAKQRKKLLKAGVNIFEFKPNPAIHSELIERYEAFDKTPPIFSIHAKTMIIDGEKLYVGTFNLDPRSANLNTEVGILVNNRKLAQQVEHSIKNDMQPENSWDARTDQADSHSSFIKRMNVRLLRLLPLNPIL